MVRPPPPSSRTPSSRTLPGAPADPSTAAGGRPLVKAEPAWRRMATVLSAPVIWSLILPFVLLDLQASAYQAICFRIYGLSRVRRAEFFRFDRSGLPHLNPVERLNCAYCTYANGVIAYVREIAARTEQYWCPIRHEPPPAGAHDRQAGFEAYRGDPAPTPSAEALALEKSHWRERLARQREALRREA